MAGALLTWTVDDAEIARGLRGILRSLDDPTPVMRALADDQAGRVRDRFKDQAGPGGTPWAPLSPVTIEKRQKDGHVPISILRATGGLAGSITWSARPSGFDLGTDGAVEDYAGIHQFGGEAGRNRSVTIPARPFMGFDDTDLDIMSEELLDWVARGDI